MPFLLIMGLFTLIAEPFITVLQQGLFTCSAVGPLPAVLGPPTVAESQGSVASATFATLVVPPLAVGISTKDTGGESAQRRGGSGKGAKSGMWTEKSFGNWEFSHEGRTAVDSIPLFAAPRTSHDTIGVGFSQRGGNWWEMKGLVHT